MKKNIVLADCVTDEVASLLNGLNKETDLNFECKSIIANWGSRGIFNVITRYLLYFYIILTVQKYYFMDIINISLVFIYRLLIY